jgi:hypothetical protein
VSIYRNNEITIMKLSCCLGTNVDVPDHHEYLQLE